MQANKPGEKVCFIHQVGLSKSHTCSEGPGPMGKAGRWTSQHSDEQLRANSPGESPVDYVEKKLKPLVPMYLQTLRQWTKMLSLTVSLGHGQPSLCLFCTQLIKSKLALHIPEQQFSWTAQRPFFHSLAFSGKIHHENKADDKENSNTDLENKLLCPQLSSLLRPTGFGWTRMCSQCKTRAPLPANCFSGTTPSFRVPSFLFLWEIVLSVPH